MVQPRLTKYIPHEPTDKQAAFLLLPHREVLFGGAAGGGKSAALLMAALQFVDVPGYSAILFRRSYTDLSLPGALMDRAEQWLGGTDARWSQIEKTWHFPSGASLTFGYLEHPKDRYRYQGAEFAFVGFDELTQFDESEYRYLFSRLRRLKGDTVPIRMRAASNPGGIGHNWVKQRFLEEGLEHERPFIPSRLEDNPHLDQAEYEESLLQLDPITRAQLREGDWETRTPGSLFRREWFEIVDQAPAGAQRARYWDLAATEATAGTDPDWTAGCLGTVKDGIFYICDMQRVRQRPKGVEDLVKHCAGFDGLETEVIVEQEPGSSGVQTIDRYLRVVLLGYTVRGDRVTGKKDVRAKPLSAAAEQGNVKLVRGPWIGEFLDELEAFPGGGHDDQVDAASGCFNALCGGPPAFAFA